MQLVTGLNDVIPRRSALLAFGLAAFSGCEASYPTIPTYPDVVARVVLQYRFPTSTVAAGSTFSFYLYSMSPDGAFTDVTFQAQYFSSDLTVARPRSDGIFTAVEPGTAEIVAAYNGFTASMPVVVRPQTRTYPFIELSGGSVGAAGGSATIRALLWQAPSQSRSIATEASWTTSDPRVATVHLGTVQTWSVGTALITVTFNGLSESIFIPVSPRS